MLGELMRLKWSLAIAGTHGKTTTTSMSGAVLEAAQLDPTVINGGIVNAYGTNTRLGAGDWMVVEADESDGSFLRLPATVAVVTNMDAEHLDHWGTVEAMTAGYYQFVASVPFYGFAVLCIDHPAGQQMIPHLSDRRIITYGFSPQADVRAERAIARKLGATFEVTVTERPRDRSRRAGPRRKAGGAGRARVFYPAADPPIPGVNRDALVEGLRANGHRSVVPLPGPEHLAEMVHAIARQGDFVVCLGAGNITAWAHALPEQLAALLAGSPAQDAANAASRRGGGRG